MAEDCDLRCIIFLFPTSFDCLPRMRRLARAVRLWRAALEARRATKRAVVRVRQGVRRRALGRAFRVWRQRAREHARLSAKGMFFF